MSPRGCAMLDKVKDSQLAHRWTLAVENAPRIPWVLVVLVPVLMMAAAPVYGRHVKKQRDTWWKAEIAKSSSAVRGVMKTGSAEAEATDQEIIDALEKDAAELAKARKTLSTSNAVVDGCAPVPARCLGLR